MGSSFSREGWKGIDRLMTSFILSRNPHKITRNPWARTPWHTSYFPVGRLVRPKVKLLLCMRTPFCPCLPSRIIRRHGITQEHHVLCDAGVCYGRTERCGSAGEFLPETNLITFTLMNATDPPAPAIRWYSSYIGLSAVLPQVWVGRVLFPRVCGSAHRHHHAQVGRKPRPEAHSKVRPSTLLYDILSVYQHRCQDGR